MCNVISPEYIIGTALLLRNKGISIKEFKIIENELVSQFGNYLIDLSRNSIYSTVNAWADYFEIQDDYIVLSAYYSNNKSHIKYRFFDTMNEEFQIKLKKIV